MEPITLGDDESPNAGGIQEKIGQPSVRLALIWIPALNRGLDLRTSWVPSNSISLWNMNIQFYVLQIQNKSENN